MTSWRAAGWQSGLSRDRPGRQVQQGAADQRGHVLADVEGVQVDQHQFVFGYQAAEVDGRPGLSDDLARYTAAEVLVDLGLDRVDDLQPSLGSRSSK